MTTATQPEPHRPVTPPEPTASYSYDGDASKMAADMAAIAAELGPITAGETAKVPTKNGGSYSYSYAGLPSIIGSLQQVLPKHNVAIVQFPLSTPKASGASTLIAGQGWTIRCEVLFPLGQASPQQVGSAVTYARRYAILGLFALAPDEDDGRGDRAEKAHSQGRQRQVQRRDEEQGRGPQGVNPQKVLDAFQPHGITEEALVAELGGTPLAKIDSGARAHLGALVKRLASGEPVQDVMSAGALEFYQPPGLPAAPEAPAQDEDTPF